MPRCHLGETTTSAQSQKRLWLGRLRLARKPWRHQWKYQRRKHEIEYDDEQRQPANRPAMEPGEERPHTSGLVLGARVIDSVSANAGKMEKELIELAEKR